MRNPWSYMSVHRIGTFTEHGLSPSLVAKFMEEANGVGCSVIIDPFVGSGVVAVEAQRRCFNFIGIDANPWGLVLTAAKTRPIDYGNLLKWIKEQIATVHEIKPFIPSPKLEKYHHPNVVEALGRLRSIVEQAIPEWRPLLLAILARTASEYSIFRRSPAPRFRKKMLSASTEEVYQRFIHLLQEAVNDLQSHNFCGTVDLIWADSSTWMPRRVCALLTSPPFANNLDYIRHTMLELLWAGLARDSSDLSWLRSLQIPACEAAARAWKPTTKHPWLLELASRIRGSRARGYRRFLLQYFYAMERHLELLSERLEWRAWYTIGDSILGGAYIPVHEILAKLAANHGLHVEKKILGERFRPGRKLYLLIFKARR